MIGQGNQSGRVWVVAAVGLLGALAAALLPPLAQPQEYHRFIDQRSWLGIPHFMDVVSNLGFLLAGLAGMAFVLRKRPGPGKGQFDPPTDAAPYAVFFMAIALTGAGSACYHWAPTDTTLVWDRAPLTVAFAAILAATVGERIGARAGMALLPVVAAAGLLSVWHWQRTGNLWPYAAAQYWPLALIGLMMALFESRYTRSGEIGVVIGWYGLAKIAEILDAPILAATGLFSGHTLKHLLATAAILWLLRMLARRRPRQSANIPSPVAADR